MYLTKPKVKPKLFTGCNDEYLEASLIPRFISSSLSSSTMSSSSSGWHWSMKDPINPVFASMSCLHVGYNQLWEYIKTKRLCRLHKRKVDNLSPSFDYLLTPKPPLGHHLDLVRIFDNLEWGSALSYVYDARLWKEIEPLWSCYLDLQMTSEILETLTLLILPGSFLRSC